MQISLGGFGGAARGASIAINTASPASAGVSRGEGAEPAAGDSAPWACAWACCGANAVHSLHPSAAPETRREGSLSSRKARSAYPGPILPKITHAAGSRIFAAANSGMTRWGWVGSKRWVSAPPQPALHLGPVGGEEGTLSPQSPPPRRMPGARAVRARSQPQGAPACAGDTERGKFVIPDKRCVLSGMTRLRRGGSGGLRSANPPYGGWRGANNAGAAGPRGRPGRRTVRHPPRARQGASPVAPAARSASIAP